MFVFYKNFPWAAVAKIDIWAQYHTTPLHRAANSGSKKAELLISKGADIHANDSDGLTPLGLASFPKGNPAKDIVERFLAEDGRK